MKNRFTITLITLLSVTTLVTTSCSKKKKGDDFAGVAGDYDYVSGTPLDARNEGANFFASNVNRTQFSPVYFAFDSFDVPSSEYSKIDQASSALRSSGKDVIIAGFTDERGTAEYNRALGERRAQAVRQALIQGGVDSSRIQTVSFGEELPADPGSSESAHALNRRSEFGVIE